MILCSLDNVKDGHPLREVGQLEIDADVRDVHL
jgi:hypothetical protein